MSTSEWPSFCQARDMAQKASEDGLGLFLYQNEDGWCWVWKHMKSGMTFEGQCDSPIMEIGIICALQAVPVLIISVD